MSVRSSGDGTGDGAEARDSTSARLLSTAAGLFWRRGHANTTTRQLSEELGLQKASLYYHMAKKEDLLFSICVESLHHISSRVRAAVLEARSPQARIEALIHAHLSSM